MRAEQEAFRLLVSAWIGTGVKVFSIRGFPSDEDVTAVVIVAPSPNMASTVHEATAEIRISGKGLDKVDGAAQKVLRLAEVLGDDRYRRSSDTDVSGDYSESRYDSGEWTESNVIFRRIEFLGSEVTSDDADLYVYNLSLNLSFLHT